MIGFLVAPILFFLLGYLFGYLMSRAIWLWPTRLIVGAVLWTPIAALLLLQRTGVIAPDTLSSVLAFLPRAIELPMIGFLVGYSITTVVAVVRREGREV